MAHKKLYLNISDTKGNIYMYIYQKYPLKYYPQFCTIHKNDFISNMPSNAVFYGRVLGFKSNQLRRTDNESRRRFDD